MDDDGKVFYHNDSTGKTTWAHPAGPGSPEVDGAPDPTLPTGWEAHHNRDGSVFFYNKSLGKTSWVHPAGLDDDLKDETLPSECVTVRGVCAPGRCPRVPPPRRDVSTLAHARTLTRPLSQNHPALLPPPSSLAPSLRCAIDLLPSPARRPRRRRCTSTQVGSAPLGRGRLLPQQHHGGDALDAPDGRRAHHMELRAHRNRGRRRGGGECCGAGGGECCGAGGGECCGAGGGKQCGGARGLESDGRRRRRDGGERGGKSGLESDGRGGCVIVSTRFPARRRSKSSCEAVYYCARKTSDEPVTAIAVAPDSF